MWGGAAAAPSRLLLAAASAGGVSAASASGSWSAPSPGRASAGKRPGAARRGCGRTRSRRGGGQSPPGRGGAAGPRYTRRGGGGSRGRDQAWCPGRGRLVRASPGASLVSGPAVAGGAQPCPGAGRRDRSPEELPPQVGSREPHAAHQGARPGSGRSVSVFPSLRALGADWVCSNPAWLSASPPISLSLICTLAVPGGGRETGITWRMHLCSGSRCAGRLVGRLEQEQVERDAVTCCCSLPLP